MINNFAQETRKISLPKVIIPPCHFDESSTGSTWAYELRHKAQEIIPGLWIGPLRVLRDTEFFQQHNIRVLISVTDVRTVPVILRDVYIPSNDYLCHSIDPGNHNTNPLAIVPQLAGTCDIIKNAQNNGIGTFIFCETGNEQSAVVAAAYIMFDRNIDLIPAIQIVQSRRFSISLDDAAKHNLQTFADICKARSVEPRGARFLRRKTSRLREDDDSITVQKRQHLQ